MSIASPPLPRARQEPAVAGAARPAAIRWSVDRWLALAIVLLATALRLVALNDGQWRNDEEIIWLLAARTLAAGTIPWAGIPSDLGVDNGPGQLLPVLPAAWLGQPYIAYVLVAFLNIAAVAALFRLGRLLYGPALGVAAALLCAVAPWDVIHSRRLWGNDMLAPFAVLFVTALWLVAARRRPWRLAEALLWLALTVQMYIAALVHVGVLLIGLALAVFHFGWRGLPRLARPALVGGGLFVLLTAGYGVTAFFPNAAALGHAVRDTRPATLAPVGLPNWAAFPFLLQSVGADGYQYYLGHAALRVDATSGVLGWSSRLAVALFLAGVLALAAQAVLAVRRPERFPRLVGALLLLAWVFALPAALVFHDAPVCACYLLPSYPAQYLVVAVGAFTAAGVATALLQRLVPAGAGIRPDAGNAPALAVATSAPRRTSFDRAGRALAWLLVAVVALPQLAAAVPFLQNIDHYWQDDRYGLPYAWHGRIVDAVAAAWSPGECIVVAGHGELDGVLRDEIATRLPAAAPRIIDDQADLALPGPGQPSMLYLLTPGASPGHAALEQLLAARPALLKQTVTVPGEGLSYRVLQVSADDATALTTLVAASDARPLDVQFANGVRLEQVAMPTRLLPKQPAAVSLLWTVPRTRPIIPSESYYVHLVAGGRTAAGLDAPFLPPGEWQAGERVLTFGTLTDPGAATTPLRDVQLGLYILRGKTAAEGVIPIAASDGSGRPLGTIRAGQAVVKAPELAPAATAALAPDLAPGLTLLGAAAPAAARPGQPLTVTLRWQAAARLPRYTVFVHVLDRAGKLVAQHDGEPDGGSFPTSGWLPGEVVKDAPTLTLPAALPPGAYTLMVGVYPSGRPEQPHAITLATPLHVAP